MQQDHRCLLFLLVILIHGSQCTMNGREGGKMCFIEAKLEL